MSFLAPLFLLGALAVAAPVIFHLIRRTTREKQPFSSLMFLQPTPPRLTKRSRLEHISLLVLRCLVFVLLALGFSRPFFPQSLTADTEREQTRRIVILLDTSASMRREGVWNAAMDAASREIRSAREGDQLALFGFDRDVQRLMTFEQWNATATGERIALALKLAGQLKPGWQETQLDRAILSAVEALEETDTRDARRKFSGPRDIVLISDLQEGARTDRLQAFEWPDGVTLRVETIKARRPTNAGLQLVAGQPSGDDEGGSTWRVRVSNSSDASRDQFAIGWATKNGDGFVGDAMDVYVPPGQSRVFPLPRTPAGLPEERLRLTGDEDDFDNTAHVIQPPPQQVRLLYLGNEAPDDTTGGLFYLQRAFPSTARQSVQVQGVRADAPAAGLDFAKAAMVVAAGRPSPQQLDALREALQGGQTVLFTLRDTEDATALARLTGVGSIPCTEAVLANYSLLARVDFEHPLFRPFADPRYSDFAKIVFWKHRRLDTNALPNARVLAAFDDGSPALLQLAAGKGVLLVLTSGWHPADSQFALSTKFVPLMHSLLRFSGLAAGESRRLTVGDALPIQASDQTRAVVRKPDGTSVQAAPGSASIVADQPGIYTVQTGGEPRRYAANIDPAESRTAPMPIEDLERLGVPVRTRDTTLKPTAAAAAAARQQLLNAELEGRQKLWRWLVVAALIVLLLETWLSGRLTRQAVGV